MDWHEDTHARYRRAFANAFSEKSLKSQAPVIEQHVDGFMAQLKKRNTVDLTDWFNFLTFDLAGDFSYGESFGCVDNGKAHPWVEIAQDFGRGLSMIAAVNLYPPVDKILRYIIPKRILQRSVDHRQMSFAQAKKRIAQNIERPDWVTPTKKYTDQKDHFTDQEWGMNLLVIAFAGSETTASALTAITRMLVQHRGVLHRLTREIREQFQNESDITVATTSDLPFLNAVIHEGMRLGPPVVIGLPRVVPEGGDLVCDRWVPGGVRCILFMSNVSQLTQCVLDLCRFQPILRISPVVQFFQPQLIYSRAFSHSQQKRRHDSISALPGGQTYVHRHESCLSGVAAHTFKAVVEF